jgi:O-antigen/teichoic acid export membrane protein
LEILIGGVVIVYILAAPFIFRVLYPTYQDSAVRLSQIFSLSLLYFPSNLFGLGLLKQRAIKSIYQVNGIYATATVLSLIILIPTFGLIGAILARIVSRTAQVTIQIFLFKTKV